MSRLPRVQENLKAGFTAEAASAARFRAYALRAEKDGAPQLANHWRELARQKDELAILQLLAAERVRGGALDVEAELAEERYENEVRPALKDELSLDSIMQVPRISKITLNMGVGDAKTDAKALDAAIEELTTIAGQRAQVRRARKSIASFKLREGMAVGARVTIRGARMYEFLDRLISIALPRIRDFRGLNPDSFDGRGNYSLGIREQIIFPEIDYDSVPAIRGLDIAITTSAATDEQGRALLRALGMPFATERRDS